MAVKAIVFPDGSIPTPGTTQLSFYASYIDVPTNTVLLQYGDNLFFGSDLTAYTPNEIQTAIQNKVIAYGVTNGITVTVNDFLWEFPNPFTVAEAASLKNIASKSYTNPTRSLNTAFQISTTRDSFVSYAVDIAASLSLTGGTTGTVTLQYADNSGMTTNLVTVNSAVNGNTGTLTIGLALTQSGTAGVSGVIPAGKFVRIATANTAGTPTFTYRSGQEVLS